MLDSASAPPAASARRRLSPAAINRLEIASPSGSLWSRIATNTRNPSESLMPNPLAIDAHAHICTEETMNLLNKETPKVASALWNMEPTIDLALKTVKEGKFKAEEYGKYSMMKYKGSELAPLGTFEKKVPAEVVTKVKAREKDILDGKFTVKVDDSQPKSTAK